MDTPKVLPEGTTQEQWDQYQLDSKNHTAFIQGRREFMERILVSVAEIGIDQTQRKFNSELNRAWSMDAPNSPGYYRANND